MQGYYGSMQDLQVPPGLPPLFFFFGIDIGGLEWSCEFVGAAKLHTLLTHTHPCQTRPHCKEKKKWLQSRTVSCVSDESFRGRAARWNPQKGASKEKNSSVHRLSKPQKRGGKPFTFPLRSAAGSFRAVFFPSSRHTDHGPNNTHHGSFLRAFGVS